MEGPDLNAPRQTVFLDRDGLLVEDVGYLRDPSQVRLLPGVAGALQELRDAGFLLIVVTNQSAIALERSHMVGDSQRDVEAGRAAGCYTIQVGPGVSGQPDAAASDLPGAGRLILRREQDVAPPGLS